jgi:two-component system nitrogen regulation response regulator NtrX
MSAARILVVDDEADIRDLVKEILAEEGYEVEVAANASEARALRGKHHPDLILLDIWMPDVDGITLLREWMNSATETCPVVMMSGHGTVDTAVEATRLGAVDFVEKPLSLAKLLRTVERGLEHGSKRRAAHKLTTLSSAAPAGKSRAMQELRAQLQRIAVGTDHVSLIGEQGSGREAFARYLHEHSPRAAQPFVSLVASSLRETDAEAMLFGAVASGASGLLDQVGEGTLFINEITDLPDTAQRALLGVLETGRYSRLGENAPRVFLGRVLTSVRESAPDSVRRDLLAHLATLSIRIPPLREYAEDVPELLRHCVDQLVDLEGMKFRRFGIAAQNRLRNYPWPGNVQELRTLVRRMLLLGGAEEISLEEIERELIPVPVPSDTLVKQDLLALSLREAREHFERAYLQQQLQLCQGKVGQLAKRVGMERTHLYRKLRALGIDFRGTSEDAES